jgi:hypothetical protein
VANRFPLSVHVLVLVLATACGSGSTGTGTADAGQTTPDAAEADVPPEIPRVPPDVTEDFRVLYEYRPKVSGQAGGALWLADPRDRKPSNDIDVSAAAGISCRLGCYADRRLEWLVVATENDPVRATSTVVAGRLGEGFAFQPIAGSERPGVRHVVVAGDHAFTSTLVPDCGPAGASPQSCYEFRRMDLAAGGTEETLFRFPPQDRLLTSGYSGRFTVGDDGETLLLWNPALVSQELWLGRGTKLERVAGPFCPAVDPAGDCIGSGSPTGFSDVHPVALSADGRHLVWVLVVDDAELRLYSRDLPAGPELYSVLLRTPGSYTQNACLNRADWQYTTVLPPLRFSPDGSEVLFLGYAACGDNKEKPWTNLVGLALDRIGSGQALAPSDLRLVTDNPTGRIPACISMTTFDLSPSGEFAVFLGTPVVESDGKTAVKESDQRQVTGSEVHVTRTDGTSLSTQITSSLPMIATQAIPVPAP